MTSKQLATACAKWAADKIASNITVMDIALYDTAPCDFFVICSADSANQAQAIADIILRQAKNNKLAKPNCEGTEECEWILLDFFDVVVHIMLPDVRAYYNIEKLWQNATFFQLNPKSGRLIKQPTVKDN